MSFCQDLRLYLWTLKYLGILSASYKREQNTFHATPKDELLGGFLLCTTQILAYGMLVYCITYTESFYLEIYNMTGNIYLSINFGLSCLVLSVVSAYFYVNRCEHANLVQHILRYNRNCLRNNHNKCFSRLYALYASLSLFCCYNYTRAFLWAEISVWAFASYIVMFSLIFMMCGIVLVFYVCMEYVLAGAFRHYNQQLEHLVVGNLCVKASRHKFRNILRQRYRLMSLCRRKVNRTYGIILIPIVVYIVFTLPSGPFFMVSVVFEISPEKYSDYLSLVLTAIMWDVPWLTVFIMIMASNGIAKEANKTVKILSKVPRCATGIEKMVEKFLLKNLRQKPILTAYGFFSLDKSTLFQLFTAIITYMVILVQFKEMETSTIQIS